MAGERVLIVDDNQITVKLTTALLSKDGFEVASETSGAKVADAVASFRPDLILMDIQMPDFDGLEVARMLKADSATAHVPIVAWTAYVDQGTEQEALDAGCSGYMKKPMNTGMPQVLRQYIEEARAGKS